MVELIASIQRKKTWKAKEGIEKEFQIVLSTDNSEQILIIDIDTIKISEDVMEGLRMKWMIK